MYNGTNGAPAGGGTPTGVPTGVNQSAYNTENDSKTKKLVLQPNIPQLIALKSPVGKIVESRFSEDNQVYFGLVDGRSAYLSLHTAQSINSLMLAHQEAFWICKRWNGERKQQPRYDVWLTPEGEQIRAQAEMQPEPQPRQSPSSAPAPPPQTPQGTGTNGPVAVPRATSATPSPNPQLSAWAQSLLAQTNQLIDIYALACEHAETQGVPNAVVRTVMLSAFIGIQRKGGA